MLSRYVAHSVALGLGLICEFARQAFSILEYLEYCDADEANGHRLGDLLLMLVPSVFIFPGCYLCWCVGGQKQRNAEWEAAATEMSRGRDSARI